MCGCSHMTTTTMELPSLVCLCVLISCGVSCADANERVKVTVMEEDDVILPCSLSTKENIESKLFDWKTDDKKEVFMYSSGEHYNNGRDGQDSQFKGRVFHFPDQLKNGNASIKIQNTKVADSGNYTCDFPLFQPSQIFHIELFVVVGAAKKPSIETLDQTNDWSLLQCVIRGVSPEPEVEWKDSSGNIVPAEEPKITERGGSYDVILNTTVTKTDRYQCVVTQKEIKHQIHAETFVHINGAASKPLVTIIKKGDEVLLQCEVLGVSPKTKVEWKDSSGNIVLAEEPKITERGGSYDVILQAPLTKTDNFCCIVTQKEIDHPIYAEIYATHEKISQGAPTAVIVAAVLGIVVLLLLFVVWKLWKRLPKKGSTENPPKEGETHPINSSDSHRPVD